MRVSWCITFCFVLIAFGNAEVLRWTKLLPAYKIGTPSNDGYKNKVLSQDEYLIKFNDTVSHTWQFFKENFKRQYKSTAEHLMRFYIFATHLYEVYIHNSLYAKGQVTYEMGVNELSDKSNDELKHYRCIRIPHNYKRSGSSYVHRPLDEVPISIDWRTVGAVTDVKDQGNCGSCYAFSAIGSLEGQHYIKQKDLVSLSEQQVVDCSSHFGNDGCGGGLMDNVFKYLNATDGAKSERDYPYVSGKSGVSRMCRLDRKEFRVAVTGYVDLPSGDEETLKQAVALHGPISIGINAGLSSFSRYTSGVYSEPDCGGQPEDLNHGVLLVGYGEANGVPYWLVKNSWGRRWGDRGYVKIRRNANNMCGVATAASYPLT